MSTDAWDRAWNAAQALPGRGAKYVRLTRTKDREWIAVATVSTTTGSGSEEVRAATGTDPDGALLALVARCGAP